MQASTLVLILVVVAVGALPPIQAGINATLARYYGHPLWGALTNTLVASLALAVVVVVARVPLPDFRAMTAAPSWSWLGGFCGAAMVFSAIVIAPRLGAAGYVTAMSVGTVGASMVIDHYGFVGFTEHPLTTLRLLGGALVVSGMVLVQSN